MQVDFGGGDEIRFERSGRAGLVTLTRPKALNALTRGMVNALAAALRAWSADESVKAVIVRGEGRAFCAGGDILEVYRSGIAGRPFPEFFAEEYVMNALLAAFPKPCVALIDGIVMGGGVGISCHGSHRVVSEKAALAMPEVGIGFFPDVGGGYLLSRVKGCFGLYLALTGNRIGWGDALWSGLATHAVASAAMEVLAAEIADTGEPDVALKNVAAIPPRETDDGSLHAIKKHFSLGSVAEIMASLEQAARGHDAFAASTLDVMKSRSPTSLLVTFQQVEAARMLSVEECLRMEYRILRRMLDGHDFYEGVRAALVDKGSKPKWRPAALGDVSQADVDAYFAPLADGELDL